MRMAKMVLFHKMYQNHIENRLDSRLYRSTYYRIGVRKQRMVPGLLESKIIENIIHDNSKIIKFKMA